MAEDETVCAICADLDRLLIFSEWTRRHITAGSNVQARNAFDRLLIAVAAIDHGLPRRSPKESAD